MLEKIISHRYVYLFFLLILLFGLSTGKFLMSLGTIAISINWIIEGGFKEKYNRLKQNHWAPFVLSLGFIIHLFWLLNTSNYEYAAKDLLIKIPLFAIPIVIGTSKAFTKKELQLILSFFLIGILISSLLSTLVYLELIPPKYNSGNFRDLSLFMSHIRLSLLVAFSSILCLYLSFFTNVSNKIWFIILACWFMFFLILLQSITGIIAWFIASFFLCICILLRKKTKSGILFSITWIAVILIIGFFIVNIISDYYEIKDKRDLSNLPIQSANGEKYLHEITNPITENGFYVWACIAPNEVEKAWNKRSLIPFDSLDFRGQPIRFTIYRYLSSKDLNKDNGGVKALNDDDIKLIEAGNATYVKYYTLEKRIREILFEIQLFNRKIEINGHSLSQRLFFTQIGLNIIKNNFWFGSGTGDVNDEYKLQYLNLKNDLHKENQLRSHNQFVTFFITYGIIGFLLWLFTIIYPIVMSFNKPKALYYAFVLIILTGFLSDDMLERQAGVAIYITINTILLFAIDKERYSILGGSKV